MPQSRRRCCGFQGTHADRQPRRNLASLLPRVRVSTPLKASSALPATMLLGRPVPLPAARTPALLQPIARSEGRRRLGLQDAALPFFGEDRWTGYELSWLDAAGKPQVAGLRLRVPCASANMVESKSLKLYLNSIAQERFASSGAVRETLLADLRPLLGKGFHLELSDLDGLAFRIVRLPGKSLDELALASCEYERNPRLLRLKDGAGAVAETWRSHLFRSLCPVTGQPDWASIAIAYQGPAIEPSALLAYLISYRCHAAFHEEVVEQLFVDIQQRCRPTQLTVSGHFLRRGGLDINPLRTTQAHWTSSGRLARQ